MPVDPVAPVFLTPILRDELLRPARLAHLIGRIQHRPLARRRQAAIQDPSVLRDELESLDRQIQKPVELYTKGQLDEAQFDSLNGRPRARRAAILDALTRHFVVSPSDTAPLRLLVPIRVRVRAA